MSAKRQALGRGLGALLSGTEVAVQNKRMEITETTEASVNGVIGAIAAIPLDLIEVNPMQPRTVFVQEQMEELSASIKVSGLIQPITVRRVGKIYQLVSGERRFRASKMAGLTEVPAYIRMVNDNEMLEMALVENIQRENLNAIDIALSYQALLDSCHYSQDTLGQRVGKSRSAVTNHLRLLKLPAEVQLALRDDKISMGHARAIITMESPEKQVEIVRVIIEKSLSVRDVEEMMRDLQARKNKKIAIKQKNVSPLFEEETKKISEKIRMPIQLSLNKSGKGNLSIRFSSEAELRNLMKMLNA